MSKYTEENLDKLLKKDLISIVLSQQTKMDAANSEIMYQIRKFNENVEKLQSELTVAKQVNSVLSERLVSMERQCWANAQYSRRECLELVGVTRCVSDGNLEEKVLKIFEKVGCPIEGNNIEACHRMSKKTKDNSEILLPKRLPKCTEGEERVDKVRHERNWFSGGQSYICEPKFVHILSFAMVKG